MAIDFAVSYPLRIIITNTREEDPHSAAIHGVQVGDLFCIAVFTDADLAARDITENGTPGKSLRLIADPIEFRRVLNITRASGFDAVIFDPGRPGRIEPFVFGFDQVLNSLA